MELFNEDNLVKFIESVVNKMIPQIVKSKFNKQDITKMVKLSSREWLNVSEAAYYMGISDTTFRKWRKEYQIPSRTIEGVTRWKKSDLDEFWKTRGVKGYL